MTGPTALEHDQVLHHFRILERIGAGGMGEVYRAYDEHLCRDVAIKVLPPGALADETARRRFRKEALSLSKINHPNIASVFDFDTHTGIDFLVMEFIPGTTLSNRLAAGTPLPTDQVVSIGVQLTEGLVAAHEQGVIHCDLKPGNLRMTPDGRLKILDFGVARLAAPRYDTAATDSMTGPPVFAGTVPYLAPEQVRNQRLDARTDVWSAGAVLYELATGRTPFEAGSPSSTLAAILEQDVLRPSKLNPEISGGLEEILLKALHKDPAQRYQSASELREDCKLLQQSGTSLAFSGSIQRRTARRKILAAVAIVIAVAIMAAVVVWVRHRSSGNVSAAKRGSIVVLPFQNVGADASINFLGLALADEIATALTHARGLEVRPVPTQATTPAESLETAKKLHVATLVSGHFVREGSRLLITMEATDVPRERLVWRDTLSVPATDVITMEKQVVARVRQALVPTVAGADQDSLQTATQPHSAEAYDLFLRSIAALSDPAPNDAAIGMLQRSVALDPNYAPAWAGLGLRYYYSSFYGGGGAAALERMVEAYERALQLDPNLVTASAHLIRTRAERGELGKAYGEAEELVHRRPEQAQSHFTRAYVLRYAGLLVDAGRECDIAVSLDPGNRDFRSCSFAYFEQGKMERAAEYLALDEGSAWYRNVQPSILLRSSKTAAVREIAGQLSTGSPWFGEIIQACVESRKVPQFRDLAKATEQDSEFTYYFATLYAMCGERELATGLLRSAIERNYCAYEAINADPALKSLRELPQFNRIKATSYECQQKFLRAITESSSK